MEFLAGLHPKMVHLPIALLLTYSFLEIVGAILKKETFLQAAYIILILGVISAVGAVLTGNQADEIAELWFDKGVNIPLSAISNHENYATISLFLFAGILILRTYLVIKKKFQGVIIYLFVILALIGSYFIIQTGLKGGQLVYNHGVGTDIIKPIQNNNSK
jgi:uncharacterized membrane protein